MAKHWIQAATKPSTKGALHRELGVPSGERIPESKLQGALSSSNPLERKRANFARNVRRLGR